MRSYEGLANKAVAAAREENWAEALDFWCQANDTEPLRQASIGMALAQSELGNYAQAYDIYASGIKKWPKSILLLQGFAKICERMDQWEVAATHWATLVEQEPDIPRWMLRLALAQERLQKFDGMLNTLKQGTKRWPSHEGLTQSLKSAQYKYSDVLEPSNITISNLHNKDTPFQDVWKWVVDQDYRVSDDKYIELLEAICETWDDKVFPRRELSTRYLRCRNYEKAFNSLLKLLPLGRPTGHDEINRAICLIALGREDDAKETLVKYIFDMDDGGDVPHQLSRILSFAKDTKVATAVLSDIYSKLKQSDNSNALRCIPNLEALLNFHKSQKVLKRPIIENWDHKFEVISSAPSTSGDVFLIFTGYGKQVGTVPLVLIDRLLAEHGASMIRLVDHTGLLYQNGIEQVAPDFETTVTQLKERIKALGGKRVFTLGTSGGGFGALRYGVTLGAENILTFSAPTNLQFDFLRKHKDFRARAVIRRLNTLLTPEQLDIGKMLERHFYKPRIDVYYCAENSGDLAQAENIKHLPNVNLHPIDDSDDHSSVNVAFSKGYLKADIERMLNASTINSLEGIRT